MRLRDFLLLVLLVAGISQYNAWRQQKKSHPIVLEPAQALELKLNEVSQKLGWTDLSFHLQGGYAHATGIRIHEAKDLVEWLSKSYGLKYLSFDGGKVFNHPHNETGRDERDRLIQATGGSSPYCIFVETYDEASGQPLGIDPWPAKYYFRAVLVSAEPDSAVEDRLYAKFQKDAANYLRTNQTIKPTRIETKLVHLDANDLFPPMPE